MFGGDPTNVTLVGHGTGAACVHFLLTSLAVPEGKPDIFLLITTITQYHYEVNTKIIFIYTLVNLRLVEQA